LLGAAVTSTLMLRLASGRTTGWLSALASARTSGFWFGLALATRVFT